MIKKIVVQLRYFLLNFNCFKITRFLDNLTVYPGIYISCQVLIKMISFVDDVYKLKVLDQMLFIKLV